MLEVRDVGPLLYSNTLTGFSPRVSAINQLSCFLPSTSGDVRAEDGLALVSDVCWVRGLTTVWRCQSLSVHWLTDWLTDWLTGCTLTLLTWGSAGKPAVTAELVTPVQHSSLRSGGGGGGGEGWGIHSPSTHILYNMCSHYGYAMWSCRINTLCLFIIWTTLIYRNILNDPSPPLHPPPPFTPGEWSEYNCILVGTYAVRYPLPGFPHSLGAQLNGCTIMNNTPLLTSVSSMSLSTQTWQYTAYSITEYIIHRIILSHSTTVRYFKVFSPKVLIKY